VTLQHLPPALARWHAALSQMPLELATALGPLLTQLDLLVGSLPTRRPSGDGEPQGFDGIERRGPYERLLLSEWLLASEAPDEFVRRAATGEHAFLHLARDEPVRKHRTIALIDAGPSQLGRPRLVQLAMLIVLAQRAARVNGELRWKLLQSRQPDFEETLDRVSLSRFLQGRSAREPVDEDIVECRIDLRTRAEQLDVWLIGGPALENLPAHRGLSLLTVWEEYDDGEPLLRARCQTRRQPGLEVELPCPSDRHAVQLIRNPFTVSIEPTPATAAPAVRKLPVNQAPGSNLVLSQQGNLVFARSRDAKYLLQFPVPNRPDDMTRRPLGFELARPAWAVGRRNRQTYWMESHDIGCAIRYDQSTGLPMLFRDPLMASSDNLSTRLGTIFVDRTLRRFIVRLDKHLLLLADGDVKIISPHVWDAEAMPDRDQVRFLGQYKDDNFVCLVDFTGKVTMSWHIGRCEQAMLSAAGYLGIAQRDGEWYMRRQHQDLRVPIPGGDRVVGCLRSNEEKLVTLSQNGRTFSVCGPSSQTLLLQAGGEVDQVTVSARLGLLAYSVIDGGLFVYSMNRRQHLLTWQVS
jgi:hypothetical protein